MIEQALPKAGPSGPMRAREMAWLYQPAFATALGYGAVLPILPRLLERLHGTGGGVDLPVHAGLLTGVYIAAFVIAAPLWGRLSDARGPRLVILVGLGGYAAATAWLGVVATLGTAYLARFLAGLFAAGLVPAISALIVARCEGSLRARHLAWLNAATILGFLVGPALAGALHDVLERSSSPFSGALHVTAIPIWTSGAIALLAALGVAGGVRTHRASNDDPNSVTVRPPIVLPMRGILILSAYGAFGLGAFEVGLTLQSQQAWRWSPAAVGGLFAVCSLVMLVIQIALFGRLQRWVAPAGVVITGFVAMAVGFLILATVSSYTAVMGLVALIAVGSGILLPTLSALLAAQSGPRIGVAIGFQSAAANLGQAAGSAAAGLLFDGSPSRPFAIVAVALFVAAALAWHVTRRPLAVASVDAEPARPSSHRVQGD